MFDITLINGEFNTDNKDLLDLEKQLNYISNEIDQLKDLTIKNE